MAAYRGCAIIGYSAVRGWVSSLMGGPQAVEFCDGGVCGFGVFGGGVSLNPNTWYTEGESRAAVPSVRLICIALLRATPQLSPKMRKLDAVHPLVIPPAAPAAA